MYLKKIELQGFKSFANRTELEFNPGITAIIGPNGSGKSNISDAMRWVLGEQSMKALRSSKSEDIIFAGTENRKSLGFAEVSIIFDNEDNSLPIEYSEVTVTRRVYRTGESGFFINKVPCRLKDIIELFMDTGIGKDGYSIIGQGRIDEILSTKSEDRRHIFEEAAGIVKYRTRREEAEKKLEQTKINLMRINDILTELEANLEPLRIQRDKARKYLDLREELKQIEVGLYLYKIENFREKLEELKRDKEILDNQNIEEEKKLQDMQSLKDELKNTIDTINEKIERLQNISFESKNEIEKINSNINVSNERITNNDTNKNRLDNEITTANKTIFELEEEKKNKESKRENLLSNKEKYTKELEEKESELSKITEKLSTKELQIEEKKKENEVLLERKYEIQNKITAIETNIENYMNRQKQEKREIEKIISELDEKRTAKNDITNELNRIETERNKNKVELENIQSKKDEIDQKQKKYEELIANLTDEKRTKTSRYNFLVETEKEKEGYAKSVKDLLIACENDARLKRGVNGVLANIVSTEEKYQTAIEMALGASLQNIVTDTDEDAKRMIEYLRANRLGRASFLPVSAIKGKRLETYAKVDGVIGLACDLVKANKKYENIVLNLLGRTMIAENIECAIKLARANRYSFKIVTLEGDIINPSGAMTGGSVNKKTVNLLGRSAEIKRLESSIKNIDVKLEEVIVEKDNFLKENENIINLITEKTDLLQKSEVELAKVNEKLNSAESEINKIIENKEKCENEIKSLQEKTENDNLEKEKYNKEITEITAKSEALVTEIEDYAKLNNDEQVYINNLNEDITNLKISISSFDESNSSIEELMERIDNDINNKKEEIERKKNEKTKLDGQNIELAKTIKDLQDSIIKIKEEVENSVKKTEELKNTRNEKNEKLDSTEKDITKQFEVIQKIKEGLVKVDSKVSNTNQDLEEIINELWENYEITPNNAMEKFEKPTNIPETQKKVNDLHNKIKDLGSVNVDAIEEYKKAEERYNTMNEQRMDLETTMAKLRDIIQDMTSTMKEQFREKFKLIQKYFNEAFIELFGGGRAELILEDENNVLESGIDIVAQPTGKKLNNLLQLSGGERALTAIALLFAILKINPSPFCILDEIEAALDDVNVYRYADYLKKFSKETQFLIITHRKGSMEAANTVYGITMEENGISKMLSINLEKK